MAGALKAGGVYVAVSASVGEFAKDLGKIIKSVEDTARKVKDAAKGIAEVGTIFAAAMGGAVAAAAQSNNRMRADLDKLKAYLYTLAADLGDAFGPFLHELTATIGSVVGAFQRLSPEVKAAVAQFVVFMASVGAGAAVVSKAAGAIESVAKVAGLVLGPALKAATAAVRALGMTSMASFGALLAPVAAVAAAIAGLVLLAGVLYEAWNDSSSGLKASVVEIWESIKGLGARLMDTLGGWFDMLKEGVLKGLKLILDGAAFVVRKVAGLMKPVAEALGLDNLAGFYGELEQLTGDRLLKDLQNGASFLADKAASAARTLADGAVAVGKGVAEGVSTGIAYSTKGLKRLAADTGLDKLPDRLRAALGGVLGGSAAKVRVEVDLTFAREALAARLTGELKPMIAEMFSVLGMQQVEVARPDRSPTFEGLERERRGLGGVFGEMRRQAQELARAAAVAMKEAREALVQRFAGAFGELSALMSTFQQGLAAGGPAGGIAAVVADLLTRSEQFSTLVATLNGLIGEVADALGTLVEPLLPLVGAIGTVVEALLQGLTPVLQNMASSLTSVTPVVVMVGELLAGLAPVLALLAQASMLVQAPMALLAGPVMKGLFEVLKFVSAVILRVVTGVADVWNGIVDAVAALMRKLADISVFGAKPLGFLDGWADGLQRARVDTDAMAKALQALTGMTYDAALEKARETAEVLRNRKELEKANESLSNVPNAWKVALARFEAQDGQSGPSMPVPVPTAPPPAGGGWNSGTPSPWGGTGATTPGQTPGGVGTGGGAAMPAPIMSAAPMIGSVTLNVQQPAEAMERLEGMLDRLGFRMFGTRGRQGRYAAEGG